MTELKPQMRMIDLAIAAGRKRQSARTRFVHLYNGEEAQDTVPLYENFCFAFALLRLKTAEGVGEGRELLDRLLAFQTAEGNFPIYLHDYPHSWDPFLALKIAPILIHAGRWFPTLKPKFESALQKILVKKALPPLWENRLMACLGKAVVPIDTSSFSAEEWREHIITEQIQSLESVFPVPYNSELQLFLGTAPQERGEPKPFPIEWALCEGQFSSRLLRDHPGQLLAASLFPFKTTLDRPAPVTWTGERLLWDGGCLTYAGAKVFCNIADKTALFIEGKKGTVFECGQTVTIETTHRVVSIRFDLEEGEGRFCGHILRANRPSQVQTKSYEAFDWCVALRTLFCSSPCLVRLTLSTASPIAWSPLSTYIVIPVTADASGDKRKTAAAATSSA